MTRGGILGAFSRHERLESSKADVFGGVKDNRPDRMPTAFAVQRAARIEHIAHRTLHTVENH
jgi:hypothetical protein